MRHGNSEANQQGIVVSDAINGVPGFGLSALGQEQVTSSIQANLDFDDETLIYSSDFLRARQTAWNVHSALACKTDVTLCEELRERFFGDYELGPDTIYNDVWQRDFANPEQTEFGVESANGVMTRVMSFLRRLNEAHEDQTLLLVAHGDILQILLTACAGKSASEHRSLVHLETAEIRRLQLPS